MDNGIALYVETTIRIIIAITIIMPVWALASGHVLLGTILLVLIWPPAWLLVWAWWNAWVNP